MHRRSGRNISLINLKLFSLAVGFDGGLGGGGGGGGSCCAGLMVEVMVEAGLMERVGGVDADGYGVVVGGVVVAMVVVVVVEVIGYVDIRCAFYFCILMLYS